MNSIIFDCYRAEVIHVRRDATIHSWAMAVADLWVPLPWKETADAVSVVLWVKEQTGGVAQVQVEPLADFSRVAGVSEPARRQL
jgi:hypothetical protein